MMHKRAFTLFELIIALALASFMLVMLGRALRNFYQVSMHAQTIMRSDADILFASGIVRRDIAGCFLPGQLGKKRPSYKGKAAENIDYFVLSAQKERLPGREGKTYRLLGDYVFLTSQVLALPHECIPSPVRVAYRLEEQALKDTTAPKKYRLIRLQTTDLDNITMSDEQNDPQGTVQKLVILENIRIFAIWVPAQITYNEADRHLNVARASEPIWQWHHKDPHKLRLPFSLACYIELWDHGNKEGIPADGYMFEVPIASWQEDTMRRWQVYAQPDTKDGEGSDDTAA